MVVVSSDLKVTTLKGSRPRAGEARNTISYGSAGIGGINQLGAELLASAAKCNSCIPYKGIGPSPTSWAAISDSAAAIASAVQHIQPGRCGPCGNRCQALAARPNCRPWPRPRCRVSARGVVGHRRPCQLPAPC